MYNPIAAPQVDNHEIYMKGEILNRSEKGKIQEQPVKVIKSIEQFPQKRLHSVVIDGKIKLLMRDIITSIIKKHEDTNER